VCCLFNVFKDAKPWWFSIFHPVHYEDKMTATKALGLISGAARIMFKILGLVICKKTKSGLIYIHVQHKWEAPIQSNDIGDYVSFNKTRFGKWQFLLDLGDKSKLHHSPEHHFAKKSILQKLFGYIFGFQQRIFLSKLCDDSDGIWLRTIIYVAPSSDDESIDDRAKNNEEYEPSVSTNSVQSVLAPSTTTINDEPEWQWKMGSIKVDLKEQPLLKTVCHKSGQLDMDVNNKIILEMRPLHGNTKLLIILA
jgi:hypothetical protein